MTNTMVINNDAPMYNLKAVVRETGLKADTLRAWERRYGVPSPHRAESGHRLYTARDIEMLKWLSARQHEGLNISRAVALWESLEERQGDPHSPPIAASVDALGRHPIASSSPVEGIGNAGEVIAELRERWIAACLNFDEQSAEQNLNHAFALVPIEDVCLKVLQQGLATIGQGWYEGRVTVHQEHFASALATRRLETLLASTPPPVRSGRILVGCPPEEAHTFVPLMLSLLLRRKGWDVLYLGANLPISGLDSTVEKSRPDLVILSAQQLHTAASLLEMAQALSHERIPVAFGGLIFNRVNDLHKIIPGYFLGARLDTVSDAVAAIMLAPRPQPPLSTAPLECQVAADHVREQRASIDAEVYRLLRYSNIPRRHVTVANANFGRNIIAALSLGKMEYLAPDLEWVDGLLDACKQQPNHDLDLYLKAYLNAARQHLDDRGRIVIEWLAKMTVVEDDLAQLPA